MFLLSVPPLKTYLTPLCVARIKAFHMIASLTSPLPKSIIISLVFQPLCCWGAQNHNHPTKERLKLNMPRRGSSSSAGGVLDRNAVERDRRLNMKQLLSTLAFLLPSLAAKPSVTEMLDEAVIHVVQLGQRVEMLKQKKKQLMLLQGTTTNQDHMIGGARGGNSCSTTTVLTVRDVGSVLEVCVKSGSNQTFILHQVIQVLMEEAAQVVGVNYSNVGGLTFCTIKAEAVCPRIGIETSTVHERLKQLIF